MKKRLLILVFAGLMSLVLLPEANASAGYSDVPQEHWAAESIQRATELGYFQGVDEGRFGLGQPISRAAFSSALVRMFGWEEVRPAKSSFDDVDKTRWFYTAAETTLANGAVAAAGQDFRPDDDLTRGEMASMLVRGLGYTSSLAETASSYGVPFSDVTVNRGFITMAYDLGLMKGKDGGRFDPDAPATREQAAAVLVRVHDQLAASSVKLSAMRRSISALPQSSRPIAASFRRISSRISARRAISSPTASPACPSFNRPSVFAAETEISASIRRKAALRFLSRSAALSPSASCRSSRLISIFSISRPIGSPLLSNRIAFARFACNCQLVFLQSLITVFDPLHKLIDFRAGQPDILFAAALLFPFCIFGTM